MTVKEITNRRPMSVNAIHTAQTPGYIDFAANHGGELVVDFEQGRFVFCFRPWGNLLWKKA